MRSFVRSMATSGHNIATNDTPLTMNSQPAPSGPFNAAANAGPTMRDPVITAVFSEIALVISCGSTNSITNPRRAGLSNAPMTPSSSDSP